MPDHATLPFDEAQQSERWLPVPGFEGLYVVSDLGRVKSLYRDDGYHGQIMKAHLAGRPPNNLYLSVRLWRDGSRKQIPVHKIVTEAFLGPRPEGLVVRHGPGGQYDNSLANLCYGTYQQNSDDMQRDGTAPAGERNVRAILTDDLVREIRARHAAGGGTYESLAAEYGVCFNTIRLAITRKTWKHVA